MKGKKFLGLPVSVIAIVLAVLVASVGVFAGIKATQEVPATVSIRAQYGLELYEDEACTIPLTSLDFIAGKPTSGNFDTGMVNYFVKNVGANTVQLTSSCDVSSILGATYAFAADGGNFVVAPNEVRMVGSKLTFTQDSPIGDYDLTIVVEANDIP